MSPDFSALSLTNNFKSIDRLARAGYRIPFNDPRRLYAIVEKALFDLVAQGHSACTEKMIIETIKKGAFELNDAKPTAQYIRDLISNHGKHQIIIDQETGLICPIAAYKIEKGIYEHIRRLLDNKTSSSPSNSAHINQAISKFNKQEQINRNDPKFSLNKKQNEAIHMIMTNGISIVTGNFGTGKETLLRAIFHVLEQSSLTYCACTVSESFAQRLRKVTNQHNQIRSIADLIQNSQKIDAQESQYVIINEAEMIDAWRLWKLLNIFAKNTRIVLIGDLAKAPLARAGLSFLTITNTSTIPQLNLEHIIRIGSDCIIPLIGQATHNGDASWSNNENLKGIDVIECDKGNVLDTVIDLYEKDPENTRIISATYEGRYAGINLFNRLCQSTSNPNGKNLISFCDKYNSHQSHGLRVGDPVIMTESNWEYNSTSNLFGRVTAAYDEPSPITVKGDRKELSLGLVKLDDESVHPILLSSMLHNSKQIQLAYCININNTHGSKFNRVIIPVPDIHSSIIDRSWLYTSLSSASASVIFVGKTAHINKIITSTPKLFSRVSALKCMLHQL